MNLYQVIYLLLIIYIFKSYFDEEIEGYLNNKIMKTKRSWHIFTGSTTNQVSQLQ